jgi:hypothetical protein
MDQLSSYIRQARELGQTDDRIGDDLVTAGWSPDQVNSYLSRPVTVLTDSPSLISQNNPSPYQLPPVQMPTQSSSKASNPPRRLIIALSALILLVILGIAISKLFESKSGYQQVASQLVNAVQAKDKSKADSLESTAAKTYFEKTAGDSSFFDSCNKAGEFCTGFFNKTNLAKSTKSVGDYTSASGQPGKKVIYVETEKSNTSTDSKCNNSNYSLEIDLVPNSQSWQVNNVLLKFNSSDNLCAS